MSTGQSFIRSFLNLLRHEKRYSEHTITAYHRDITQFIEFLDLPQEQELVGVSFIQVRQWIVHLMSNEISAKTVNRKLSSLRTFYQFLKKKNLIHVNPTSKIQGPKAGKRLPAYLKEQEIDKMFLTLQFPEGWTGSRDRLILELLYECGLRRSELIGLELKNVNFTSGLIKVLGKGNKERLLPISKQLVTSIKEYIDQRENEVESKCSFLIVTDRGEKTYPKFIYNKVVHYLSQITTLEKRSPHVLRHTFATHLTTRGAEINAVKDLLGHESLAATQVYTHNDIEKLKKAYKGAHPRS